MPKNNDKLEPVQQASESKSEVAPIKAPKGSSKAEPSVKHPDATAASVPDKTDTKADKPLTSVRSETMPKAVVKDAAVTAPKPEVAASEVATEPVEPKAPRNWRPLATKIAAAAVALAAVVVLVFGVLIYAYQSESPVVYAVAKIIPYPAARVNGTFVSYSDYLFQLNANKRGYLQNAKLNNQPAVDFNSAAGKKIVRQFHTASIEKVKSDAITAQLAADKKVKVTDKDVDTLIGQLYKNYGGKATLLKTLKDIYGWDINDLRRVVGRQLLEQKLSEKVTSDPVIDKLAKDKAADVAKKVKDGGDFAALAKQYSQASDAAAGGDLGTFTKGQVSDEIQKAVDALPVDGVSDPIKDQYGYEIIKVTEKNADNAKASHILIKTIDFSDYMSQQIKKAKFKQYIKA